jgi:hypothetical protein
LLTETISTLIESEIQACVATHINPLKEIVHKQEKIIENHEQKMCKQFIQINTLERTFKDQSLAINEHEAELESLHMYCKYPISNRRCLLDE